LKQPDLKQIIDQSIDNSNHWTLRKQCNSKEIEFAERNLMLYTNRLKELTKLLDSLPSQIGETRRIIREWEEIIKAGGFKQYSEKEKA
jgi:hypothetical protein